MKPKLLVAAMALPLLGLGTYALHQRRTRADDGFRSGVFDPPREAPGFTLDGSNGSKVHLRDYLGKVVVLEFGFTSCQQVCPVTLAHLAQAHAMLGHAASSMQVLYVTVDPDRDTAERLHQYLGQFDPTFMGATGTDDELAAVRNDYGILAEAVASRDKQADYQVNHSSFIYLIDRQGRIRTLVPFGRPAEDIAHDILLLLGA